MENIIKKKISKEYNFINKPPNNNKFIVLFIATGLVYFYLKR